MAFCSEHPTRNQNPEFTPVSETTSIPTPFICEVPPPGLVVNEEDYFKYCVWILEGGSKKN